MHQADRRNGGRTRRLDQCGGEGTGQEAREWAARGASKNLPELFIGQRLQPVGHDRHTEQEEPETACRVENP